MYFLPSNFLLSPRRQLVRFLFIVSGMILIGFDFLSNLDWETDKTLWIIDNSLSMAVTDIHTESGVMLSRLNFAKQIITSNSANISGEQAIMTAAYGARLELPMTDDRWAFLNVTQGIGIIKNGGGSMVSSPLETVRLLYGKTRNLHIVWITDGEFSDSGATLSGFLSVPNISFIWVGSRSGWPILEWYTNEWYPRYKESYWQRVNSIRDDLKLQTISSAIWASLKLLDSAKSELVPIASFNQTTVTDYLYIRLIGIICILCWLMLPKYHYHFTKINWN